MRRGGAPPSGEGPAFAAAVEGLRVRYPERSEWALDDVFLRVPNGARWALLGLNGSGKSTLLKALAGVLRPASGSVRLFGQPVGRVRARVAYLPQRGDIAWRFPVSVREFVLAGRFVHLGWFCRPRAADRRRTEEALGQLGIHDLANRSIGDLSGGQQQRVLIARALVQEAPLLLLDEPLNAVDTHTRQIVLQVLDRLHANGVTTIMATHDVESADLAFEGVTALAEGRVVETDAWRRLAAAHAAIECGREGSS